jgi:plastocyanin
MVHPHVRRFVFALGTALVLVSAACSADKTTSPSGEVVDVYTPGSIFSPATATIGVGGTVRFNISRGADGDGHDVTFNHATPGAPADIPVTNNPTVTVVSRVFTVRGTFAYQCFVHPGMAGEVVVH